MQAARDPLRYFRIEAQEIAHGLGEGVLRLEKDMSPELVAHLLRLAHTLKGAASVVRQRSIAGLAHALEDMLSPFRERQTAFPREKADQILAQVDSIAAEVKSLNAPASSSNIQASAPQVAHNSQELDGLLREISGAGAYLNELDGMLDRAAGTGRLGHAQTLQSLKDGLDRTGREIRQAHALAEGLRLQSCGVMFAAAERAVRDAANARGLDVRFASEGAGIKLDTDILSVLQGALVQLVRNAVMHGIEDADTRARAGKTPQGLVEVSARRMGGKVAIAVRDDGGGMDLDAVRRAAQARGLAAPHGDHGLIELVLAGGISTAPALSELSGRGIGMDVVREAMKRLGGEVRADTARGQGTTITLATPVSLSALDALLVAVGDVTAAIPLNAVRESLKLDGAPNGSILHDGRSLPYAPLSDCLLLNREGMADGKPPRSALIIKSGDTEAAIGVERLLGADSIVIRPVPALAFADPMVFAIALDAGGTPRPVLDAEALLNAARNTKPAAPPAQKITPPILVIDDSLTTRVLEQSILESAGYRVDMAASAEEGIAKARQRDYGLFLVDVEMPGMDGFGFVETTRADPALGKTPVIMVTSRNAPADRQRGMSAGAHAYVIKSEFDQGVVLDIIHRLLG